MLWSPQLTENRKIFCKFITFPLWKHRRYDGSAPALVTWTQSMMAGPPVSLYPGAGDQSEGGITPRLTNQKAGLRLWRQFMRRRRRHRRHWLQRRERSWELNFKVRWMFVFCLNVHCILIFTDKERGLNNTNTLSKKCLCKPTPTRCHEFSFCNKTNKMPSPSLGSIIE